MKRDIFWNVKVKAETTSQVAVCTMGSFMALAYMSCGASTAATVFGWLQDLVSASAIVHWIIICIVYLRFYYGCKVSS